MNKSWIKYLITTAVGLGMAYIVLQIRGIWLASDSKTVFKYLHDAFFIAGILLASFGALLFCSSNGAFDGIAYLFHIMFVGHNWSKTNFKDRQTYGEYVEEKKQKRENRMKIGFVLITGFAFIAVSLVFFAIYYNV